jgi:hypothetical protein
VLRGAQNHGGGVGIECLQPQSFHLFNLLGIRPGGVVLVVIVEAKQREDLVNGLDPLPVRRFWRLSWPSWCR